MFTSSQKRKTVAELAPSDFDALIAENNQAENPVAGSSKAPKIQPKKLAEIKTCLRKQFLSDLTKS